VTNTGAGRSQSARQQRRSNGELEDFRELRAAISGEKREDGIFARNAKLAIAATRTDLIKLP
jgi:hypothetical protein